MTEGGGDPALLGGMDRADEEGDMRGRAEVHDERHGAGVASTAAVGAERKRVVDDVPEVLDQRSPLTTPDGTWAGVVHLTAECAPYARTGGLGEAVASLANFQAASAMHASVIMPLYRQAREKLDRLIPVGEPYVVQVGGRTELARLYALPPEPPDASRERRSRPRPRIFFIHNSYYFDRPGIYGEGSDYPDNDRRYAFFCAAALRALPRIASTPLILHCHDWQMALAPVFLRVRHDGEPFYQEVSSVLTVHNAAFQGHFPPETMPALGLPWSLYNFTQLEWYGRVNLLKGGMAFADAVTTVSRTHANELRTPGGGFGLSDAFLALRDRFVGIVNGIDQRIWNPETDPRIASNYSRDCLGNKLLCRAALQREYSLPVREGIPIFAMAARLVAQKGLDLVLGDGSLFEEDAQFIFLGAGEPRYVNALRRAQERWPTRVRVETNFTDEREHHLIAGGDVLLMPCQYEPCGLTQMRAQRYGMLPVVRCVGGLADTVEDGITGFAFDEYDARAFAHAVARAMHRFHSRDRWTRMMREAMSRDFAWERSEEKYLSVYRGVLASGWPRR